MPPAVSTASLGTLIGAHATKDTPLAEHSLNRLPCNSQIARLQEGVFKIQFQAGARTHFGSGVVIDERGLAITALHVLTPDSSAGWNEPCAILSGGRRSPITILKTSVEADLALISLPSGPRYRAIKQEERPIESGDVAFALGYPAGEKQLAGGTILFPTRKADVSAAFDRFNARAEPINYRSCLIRDDLLGGSVFSGNIISTNAIQHGSSGGALLSIDGTMIGLMVAFKSNTEILAEDLLTMTGVDLRDYGLPPRIAISRSIPQIKTALGL
jgi:putative serine protease PepD